MSHIFSRITVEKRRADCCDQWDLCHEGVWISWKILQHWPPGNVSSASSSQLVIWLNCLSIFWKDHLLGSSQLPNPLDFGCLFFFLPAIMANQPTPSPKEPPGEIWPLLIRACENHWFPLMLGRLWAPYFWGRLTSHGFNEDPTMLRLPWHLAICQGNQWLLPRNLTWLDGKSTMNEWRCISYWR